MNTACIRFIVIFIALHLVSAVQAEELKSGWEYWPPFQYEEAGGRLTGLDVDLVSAIFEPTEYTISYYKIGWSGLVNRIRNGTLHFALGASKSPERELFARFSEPYRAENVKLFVRKGESGKYDFTDLSDLFGSSFILGVTAGYYYGDEYERLLNQPGQRLTVETVNRDALNIRKLILKRIDGFLLDKIPADRMIRGMGLEDKIEVYPVYVHSNDVYIMFSRKSTGPELVETFNRRLKQIKSSGRYEKIMRKYQQ